jgi:hypothetical protein
MIAEWSGQDWAAVIGAGSAALIAVGGFIIGLHRSNAKKLNALHGQIEAMGMDSTQMARYIEEVRRAAMVVGIELGREEALAELQLKESIEFMEKITQTNAERRKKGEPDLTEDEAHRMRKKK